MAESERDLLERVFALILEERATSGKRASIAPYREPSDLRERLDIRIPEEGLSDSELIEAIRRYLDGSIDTGNPRFLNQLFAGFNPPAFAGEIIAALRNTSMYTYEVAPAATLIELELINKMGGLVGYDRAEGTFVTGGSNANLLAMVLARNAAAPDVKWHGYGDTPAMTLFVSEQSHYSFEQAAHLLGIGIANVRKIETDGDGRMIPDRLEAAIVASKEAGELPFFVGATAGTTVLGSFDPLPAIADIAEAHDLWFHVDGSWGGPVVLSRKWRHLIEGCERSNSFGWTPHKLMNVPLVCSVLLIQEPNTLRPNLNLTEAAAEYLFHDGDEDNCDLGRKSLQCGRRVDVLKLWFSWLSHGDRGYEERINRLFELTEYVERRVTEADDFELVAPVQSLNVCFRYLPSGDGDIDQINLDARNRLKAEGHTLVNYSTVDGKVAFRLVVANPDLTREDLDSVLDGIRAAAESLQPERVG